MPNITILDTTLRDGEQTPGVSFSLEAKLAIARKLDELGVGMIEAGSAVTSESEARAIKAVASEGLKAKIFSFARILRTDIDSAVSAGVSGVHLVAPTSDSHITRKLKLSRSELLERVSDSVSYAKSHGLLVELSAEDGSRTQPDFLESVFRAGLAAGADRLCVCDTVGVLTPERAKPLFEVLSSRFHVPLAVHCHNDLGLAVANSLAAVRGGAREVHCTVNGLGERTGNAPLEEIVVSLSKHYGFETGLDLSLLTSVSDLVSTLSGVSVSLNKPIVGRHAFVHTAGIHIDGMLKDSSTYEALTPEIVGARREFALSKHVGVSAVRDRLSQLGFSVPEGQLPDIVLRIKRLGDSGKAITDADLLAISESALTKNLARPIEILDVRAVSSRSSPPEAKVSVRINGRLVEASASGVGPLDAAMAALQDALKGIEDTSNIRLVYYDVRSVTGGTNALVDTRIDITNGKETLVSRNIGPDVVQSAVDAMVEGVNRFLLRAKR